MKRLFFISLLLCFLLPALRSYGQSGRDQAVMRIKTSIQKCPVCGKLITDYFRRVEGILRVDVNYYNKMVTVRYMPSQIQPSYILTDIANIGFDADTVKANPESYERLPACCKKSDNPGKR